VAGDLHRARLHLTLAHHCEQPVQVGSLGRGQRGRDVAAVDPRPDGADRRGPDRRVLERRLGEAHSRGLALGAGHADHPQRRGGLAVQPGGEPAEQLAWPVDHDDRDVGSRALGPSGVGDDGDRACLESLAEEPDAVRPSARERGVQVTWLHAVRAQREAGDDDVGVADQSRLLPGRGEPVHQVGEARARRLLRTRSHVRSLAHHHSTGSREGWVPVGGTP
jgi:hypothetical protein